MNVRKAQSSTPTLDKILVDAINKSKEKTPNSYRKIYLKHQDAIKRGVTWADINETLQNGRNALTDLLGDRLAAATDIKLKVVDAHTHMQTTAADAVKHMMNGDISNQSDFEVALKVAKLEGGLKFGAAMMDLQTNLTKRENREKKMVANLIKSLGKKAQKRQNKIFKYDKSVQGIEPNVKAQIRVRAASPKTVEFKDKSGKPIGTIRL